MHSFPREIWTNGNCRDAPTNLFYPDRDASTYTDTADAARMYCRGASPGTVCPVLLECLFFGLVTEDRFGIWGGMSPRERNALRRSGSLAKYQTAREHIESPYYVLVDNYLEQRADSKASDQADGKGGRQPSEDIPGRDEA